LEKLGIVVFSFGVPYDILSNLRIAVFARLEAEWFNAGIYTQKDIQIEKREPEIPVTYTKEEPGNPPPSLRIARGAIQWAKDLGLSKILVIAAKPHIWRCARDLKYAAKEAGISIEIEKFKPILQFKCWFDSESTQERVHSARNWWPREIILRLMPMFIYKRIAG
jgi:hypothetical protein